MIAYVDFNGNSMREPAEPQASALGTFVDNAPPSCKVKVSGDRLGGGGAGKPLVIVVDCSEPAKVTAAVTLQPGAKVKKAGASASRAKPVKVKLKPTSATVKAGQPFSLKLAIPPKVAHEVRGLEAEGADQADRPRHGGERQEDRPDQDDQARQGREG